MNIIVIFLCSIISISISACPTCVGRVIHDSPLFFSQEFYEKERRNVPEKDAHKNNAESDTKNNKELQS